MWRHRIDGDIRSSARWALRRTGVLLIVAAPFAVGF
jgi:hypothetical protein